MSNSAMGDSYQERVRYYRQQREQARAYKQRNEKKETYSNIDFDEALYQFKNKGKTEKMIDDASRYATEFLKGIGANHFSEHLAWYRDEEKGIIGGVCAGIADKMSWNVKNVRLATVVSGLIFTVPTVLIYAISTYILRNKGLAYQGNKNERDFWRSANQETRSKSSNKDLDAQFEALAEEL